MLHEFRLVSPLRSHFRVLLRARPPWEVFLDRAYRGREISPDWWDRKGDSRIRCRE